jgi:membrane-anchored protein YejM (alkaline phosphatase superfamily)
VTRPLASASVRLWALNLLLAWAQAATYLRHLPDRSAMTILFACAALAASVAVLSLVAGLPLALLARLPSPRAVGALHVAAWTAFQLLVFADARIYDLFRFHLNGTAWAMITTPGAQDAIPVDARLAVACVLTALALGALELLGWRAWALRGAPVDAARRRVRPALAWAGALFALLLAEKAIHARADIVGDRRIGAAAALPPGYYRLTVRRFARQRLGIVAAEPRVATTGSMLQFRDPLAPLELDPRVPRPHVVVLVSDSLRADALTEEVMPRTWALARTGRRFTNHLSGGNTTRYGTFTLLYGIPGTYWQAAIDDRAPSPLVEAHRAAGSDVLVLGSASLDVPPLLSTAFVTVQDRAVHRLRRESPIARDDALRDRALSWLRERRVRGEPRPMFLFALLDATHQVYSHPPDVAPFQPEAPAIDYLGLAGDPDAETARRLVNRYRNAARYADGVIADIVDELRAGGELDDAIVVITSDHGESFGEHGAWGHGSSPCAEQARVPLVLLGRGVAPGVETRPTSHVDVAPTLLEACGIPAERRLDHSVGASLLDPPAHRARFVTNWDRVTAWTDDGVLIGLPLEAWLGPADVLDAAACEPLQGDAASLDAHAEVLRQLLEETRRFMR